MASSAAAAVAAATARKRPAPGGACSAEGDKKKRARYEFTSIDNYEVLEKLADGPSAAVFRARDRRTGEPVAVKWIRGDGATAAVREAGCLAACRGHRSIVQIKDVAAGEAAAEDLFLVMELAGPSLRSLLATRRRPFSGREARASMRQLLAAAERLHATRTIHRNISPDNILVGGASADDGALKLCGFGSATPVRPVREENPQECVGTARYCSPEHLNAPSCQGTAGDVWALGCVMAELLTGEPLFAAASEDDVLPQAVDLYDDLTVGGLDAFDGMDLSLAGRELLAGLLGFYVDERLTAEEALKHRWFTEEEAAAKPEYPGFVPLFSEA